MNRRDKVATALACGLAGDVVRTFGEVRLRVFGTSMVPSIHPGDLVTVQRADISEISCGEVVLYSREGRMFVHRVAECGNNSDGPFLITRGDRLRQNDPLITTAELLGRVTSVQCDNREIDFVSRAGEANGGLLRLLQTSDRATYIYVRFARFWRVPLPSRSACQA